MDKGAEENMRQGYYKCHQCGREFISSFPFKSLSCDCGAKIERSGLLSDERASKLVCVWELEKEEGEPRP